VKYKPQPISENDLQGGEADLKVLQEDNWLMDSAVIPRVVKIAGMWRVSLVMAWQKDPLQLVCRYINSYPTEAKARLHADMYCRTAQKDERGTQKITWHDQDICTN
jgi:hypothetical protein